MTPWINHTYAGQLLDRAIYFYDNKKNQLSIANITLCNLFQDGANWMAKALETIRGSEVKIPNLNYNLHGYMKYILSVLVASIPIVIAIRYHIYLPLILMPLLFYCTEVQFLFLFPLLIEQHSSPYSESVRMTKASGGTIRCAFTVMQIAFVMLFGGFFKQGFVRSWAVGCLAVLLWYEEQKS